MLSFAFLQNSPVRQVISLPLATAFVISYRDLPGPGYRNQLTVGLCDRLQIMKTNLTGMFHLNAVDRCRPRRSTANMERTHGELCSWLTNRLGRDNTDGLTNIYNMSTPKITTIAITTNAISRVTGNWTTHDHFIDTGILDNICQFLINKRAPS
jgi:hypothetical protein